MSFYGKKHTEETKAKMSQRAIERYKNETPEKREHRIQAHKDYYERLRANIINGTENELHQSYVQKIKKEYEKLKDNGEI